jgi:hypothetical protein
MLSDGIEEYVALTRMGNRPGVPDLVRADEADAGAGS